VDFTGKRVAVLGTGASGVQVISEIAKTAGHLTVFQRTGNWCAPLHNAPITAEEQRAVKATYPEIFAKCNETFGGFIHGADSRMAMEVSADEREATFEKLYGEPGFGIWMANFRDLLVSEEANATISDFIARKIRARVKDPVTAEALIPRDHGFGTRRVPMETNYDEVYNQDNVRLVDLRKTPIERVTPTGFQTSVESFEFDIIIYATGFDPVTGAFDRIDIRGESGKRLSEAWAEGLRTYLGIQYPGFPNLLTVVGPHNAAVFCNMTRCIEYNVDWITGLIRHMQEHGYTRVSPSTAAAEAWTAHVSDASSMLLMSRVNSWFTGVNPNDAHKRERRVLVYAGGAPAYRERCDAVAANCYEGFDFA
jgi:cation diffusion facilitator CzcD-associated flavoprotein CzcO